MRFFLLLLISINAPNLFAQELKIKKTKFRGSKTIKEEYHVLKKDKKCKHGEYTLYYPSGIAKVNGFYKNNLKHGKWTLLKSNNDVKEIQYYTNGKKSGIWEKYFEKGSVVKRFDQEKQQKLKTLIFVRLDYPPKARELGIEGEVEIKFFLDKNCNIYKHEIIKSVGGGCNEEAVKKYNKFCNLSKRYAPESDFCQRLCEKKEFIQKAAFVIEED